MNSPKSKSRKSQVKGLLDLGLLDFRLFFIAFPIAFLAVFFYWPLTKILQEGFQGSSGFTLKYFLKIFADPYFQHIILFTAKQALLSTLAAAILGFPWAFILTHYDFPGKRIAKSLTIVPFVLPAITVALGFILAFGNNGFINRWLMELFNLDRPPLRILYSLQGIVLAHAFYNAPIIARMVAASWERIDPTYEESARALGAKSFQVFKDITWPMLIPGLMTGSALAFIFTFLSFPIVLTLGGARFSTIEVEIYTRVITMLDYKLGAALTVVQMAISLLFTYAYLKIQGRFSREIESSRKYKTVPLFGLRNLLSPKRLSVYLFMGFFSLIFLGPILGVFVDSITYHRGGEREQGIFHWYSYIFQPDYEALIGASPLQSILNSLGFGMAATIIALLLGTMISFVIARFKFTGRRAFDTIVMAPLAVSSIALGFGLLQLRAFLGPFWMAIVIAHAILAYPFVIRAIVPILEGLDRNLIEAARSLGASRGRAFKDIELPLIKTGLLVGAVFAFALSAGETSATMMLSHPGLKTIPVTIYNFLAARNFGAASAMSVLLIIVTALAFIIMERFGEAIFKR